MQALVFGATGQVGRELLRLAPERGIRTTAPSRAETDLASPAAAARAVLDAEADVVVNAAAFTAVDRAEEERTLAFAVNAAAPGAMAEAASARGLPFLHVSTDYVFDDHPGPPRREGDLACPVSAYGESKLAGERAAMASAPDAVIVRTAWVFSAHGSNFVRTMLAQAGTRDPLRVVADQIGGPTAARDIAAALWAIAATRLGGRGAPGIYHFAGQPPTTWTAFADEIFRRAGLRPAPQIVAIRSDEWPAAARRPVNSVMDCTAIREAYGLEPPDWRPALDAVIAELRERETLEHE
jgi:dTDP-4-dehydrorhamnose reductase